jgi:ATP-dependent DNA helicase RecG
MHRLLQGEVGSGKTLVAITALLMAVQGGYQGALMAPTEVLAEQLYSVASSMLADLAVPSDGTLLAERPVTVALLTNRVGAADRRKIAAGLAAGQVDIVVGTHALLYGDAPFTKLGLAVIDEQHRFGVEQRALLRDLGTAPDVLVMTATPIPRTAAMLVYGDLDRSELREMPPGRTPIVTEVVGPSPLDRRAVYDRLREQVAAGRQAYVVCPLVEGSPKIEAKAATEELEELAGGELSGLRLGLLHGQMKSVEKEAAMTAFRAGETDVLVATTVIEVGVDVPNATVMIVEDADRFGLSQLHQLRGRVGRGAHESYCVLLADPATDDAAARLEAMVRTTDGFELAEVDLELRGEGTLLAARQSGVPDLRHARISRDRRLAITARREAQRHLDADPELRSPASQLMASEARRLFGAEIDWLTRA